MPLTFKNFRIQCLKCGKIRQVSKEDFVEETDSEERSMGLEIHYNWIFDSDCEYSNCAHPIRVELDAWEYPLGIVNYHEKRIDGAFFIESPNIEVVQEEEDCDETAK